MPKFKDEAMTKISNTFHKSERLCSQILIKNLFAQGTVFTQYPFKIISQSTDCNTASPIQLIITVSKRNFKKAVDRNRIKRLIREAYRKNKIALYTALKTKKCLLAIIYTSKQELTYQEIELKIILTLQRLIKQYE